MVTILVAADGSLKMPQVSIACAATVQRPRCLAPCSVLAACAASAGVMCCAVCCPQHTKHAVVPAGS